MDVKHLYKLQSSSCCQEASCLPGIGRRLAQKIWEIVESGELRKLDELTSLEEAKALEVFTNVWGAGIDLLQLFNSMCSCHVAV